MVLYYCILFQLINHIYGLGVIQLRNNVALVQKKISLFQKEQISHQKSSDEENTIRASMIN